MSQKYTTAHRINYGQKIIPIKKVSLFSPDEWEEFIEEWLDIKEIYLESERFGGAGDMGRDVVAYKNDKTNPAYNWDCYQCKHYNTPLMPSQVYVEFGKIIYHTFKNEFPVPDKYFFIAPQGVGTSLSRLLQDKDKLKETIADNWEKYCKDNITAHEVELSGELLKYFDEFDFSIFDKISVKEIIEEHKDHPNHLIRFGGGLPDREKLDEASIPREIQADEVNYVSQLYGAYSSQSGITYNTFEDFGDNLHFSNHFKRARISFHHAEQLRNFSRDSLPLNTFEDFQDEILGAVIDIAESEHSDGFAKVKEVEREARKVVISSNPLKDVSIMHDRSGVCHQLANDQKLKWV